MVKQETDFYATDYNRNGLGPTLNWYKMGAINHEDELRSDLRAVVWSALLTL